MPPNRIVALATPVAAPLAGWLATFIAQQLPGVNIPASALEEIFIAGALVLLGSSAQWLHGYQKYEAREAAATQAADLADDREIEQGAGAPEISSGGSDPLLDGIEDDGSDDDVDEDIEALLAGDDLGEEDDDPLLAPAGRPGHIG